ncbi:MAG: DUF1223 domain-containing protein, partial [Pirellulales bacterium]|nr:DUF1223 domain-containing protein [Pirellulales bacterium]
ELFTSQGCSSCPPADQVMRDLVDRHEREDYPVLGLSFHVDYWNYLGWSDPFSSPQWSTRQRTYARVLQDRVYTPQMIVNGQTPFVGSRRKQLQQLLDQHVGQQAGHTIKLAASLRGDNVVVKYAVQGPQQSHLINIALVARSLAAKADAGENAGRTLSHANVVRDFTVRRLHSDGGEAVLRRPASERTKYSLIAYVQRVQAVTISGATEQPIESSS